MDDTKEGDTVVQVRDNKSLYEMSKEELLVEYHLLIAVVGALLGKLNLKVAIKEDDLNWEGRIIRYGEDDKLIVERIDGQNSNNPN